MELTLKTLQVAVRGTACAFRCRSELQPAGGAGSKVFPPTYAGGAYAREQRRVPGRDEPVECVLLDSVQSQANRMEEALQMALDEGRLSIPVVEIDFSAADKDLLSPICRVTSLQAPHRVADAILRDSLLDGKPFRQSGKGKVLDLASPSNATPLYHLCPTALIFGMWDSTGPKGGMGAKFQRAIVSEIIGIDAVYGTKTSSRIDPLQIVKDAGPLFRTPDGGWTLDETAALAKDGKLVLYRQSKGKDVLWDPVADKDTMPDAGRPSVANHGNVRPDIDYRRDQNKKVVRDEDGNPVMIGGVTIGSAEQVITLSLAALRRLQFPLDGRSSPDVNVAGRTVLAALGLSAAALAAEKGFDLRSRCLLWPIGPMEWELLDQPGQTPEHLTIEADAAIALLNEAVAAAEGLGLRWQTKPLTLKPKPGLVALVNKSQRLASAGGAEEGD